MFLTQESRDGFGSVEPALSPAFVAMCLGLRAKWDGREQ